MYKLLIVDDEYEIRNGLSNYFPWNDIGFKVVGQQENGKQAFQYILTNHVDVVLCDIKMPIMSGIDLARVIKEQKLKVKIVFLSGYREFEFAQKALEYSVHSYIVKSLKNKDIIDVFINLKDELDQERGQKHTPLRQNNEETSNIDIDYNRRIVALIKSFVINHYKDVTLEVVADHVHMNPYYVSKFFKQKTGQNFSDFVIQVKMQKAAELLNRSEYRMYEISELIGYENTKSFTRMFKRFYGKTPREYRYSGRLNK